MLRRPVRSDARRASVTAARAKPLDGERALDEPLRRGDQLRHALLGVREDRVAAAVQAESFLEDGEGAVERQVAAGQRVHGRFEGREGILEVRLFGHGSSCFWLKWTPIPPSWKRTAKATPGSTSPACATASPSSR